MSLVAVHPLLGKSFTVCFRTRSHSHNPLVSAHVEHFESPAALGSFNRYENAHVGARYVCPRAIPFKRQSTSINLTGYDYILIVNVSEGLQFGALLKCSAVDPELRVVLLKVNRFPIGKRKLSKQFFPSAKFLRGLSDSKSSTTMYILPSIILLSLCVRILG